MHRIDSHAHYRLDNNAQDIAFLRELDLKIVNVAVPLDSTGNWRAGQLPYYEDLYRRYPGQFAWITGFDLPGYKESTSTYADRMIAQLKHDFEKGGAIGCKFWKNIGMELKDPSGRVVLIDDPIFEPIFGWMEKNRYPALAHIAEPIDCWRPLDPNSLHHGYFSQNNQWYMYDKPHMPSHETLMQSRDNVVARHPKLPFIGAHLGSMEHDLDGVAARLDRFPNYAVDISGRTIDLFPQDSAKVRQFMIRYADRIFWSTDAGMGPSAKATPEQRQGTYKWLRDVYQTELDYYTTDKVCRLGRFSAKGLSLDPETQQKIFVTSAQHWYPGL